MKILIMSMAIFMISCQATKFSNGTYKVATAKKMNGKSVIRFEGLNKEFVVDTDTLKRGDLVYFAPRQDQK